MRFLVKTLAVEAELVTLRMLQRVLNQQISTGALAVTLLSPSGFKGF